MDTDFTSDTSFNVDLAPVKQRLHRRTGNHVDAVDRADFEAGFAAGAVIGVDNRDLLRQLLLLSHRTPRH